MFMRPQPIARMPNVHSLNGTESDRERESLGTNYKPYSGGHELTRRATDKMKDGNMLPPKTSKKKPQYNEARTIRSALRRDEQSEESDEDELDDPHPKFMSPTYGSQTLQPTTNNGLKHDEIIRAIDSLPAHNENYLWEKTTELLERNKEYIGIEGADAMKSTILHKLVTGYQRNSPRTAAIAYLLGEYPELFHAQDKSDNTPLGRAVAEDNVDATCTFLSYAKEEDWWKALVQRINGGHTPLTMAVHRYTYKPDTKTSEFATCLQALLVELSDIKGLNQALTTADAIGNTPLHYIVKSAEFPSPKLFVRIVQFMLNRGPEALQMKNNKENTPYHVRQKFLDKNAGFCVIQDKPQKPSPDEGVQDDLQLKAAKPRTGNDKVGGEGLGEKKRSKQAISYRYKSMAMVSSAPVPTQQPRIDEQSSTTIPCSGDLAEVRDYISELMKLHCMLNEYPTASILYKPGKERSTYLDLTSYQDQKIPYENLAYLANPCFETILQSVKIPQLQIINPPPDDTAPTQHREDETRAGSEATTAKRGRRRTSQKTTTTERAQRRDFEYIFQWLRSQNVVRILELKIDDFPGREAHSDEVIERALQGFHIDVLDWKRNDVCSGTFLAAAPEVKKLYLYSTGNNATLWGWSGADGLKRLQRLKTVELIVHPVLDSHKRTAENIDTFVNRMKKFCPDVKVNPHYDSTSNSGQAEGGNGEDTKQSSDVWIEVMREWATFTTEFSHVPKPLARTRPIVAILDDGVDVLKDEIKDRLIGGMSYKREITTGEEKERYCGWQVGPSSHGSIMAALVLRMCPQASILPVRLDTYPKQGGGNNPSFTVSSATKAVKWATSQDVDIISMSWSIETSNSSNDERLKAELEELKKALQAAAEKDILLFCATSDKGNETSENLYPGASGVTMFRIGAATTTGEISQVVRSRHVDFIFPGEGVPIDHMRTTADGSSIATALAAGMAAMLLHCTSLLLPNRPEIRKKYHTRQALGKAFVHMKGGPDVAPTVKGPFSISEELRDAVVSDGNWKELLRLKMLNDIGIIDQDTFWAGNKEDPKMKGRYS